MTEKKRWQDEVAESARRHYEKCLAEPPPPGMIRPDPKNPFAHGNPAAIEAWKARLAGKKPTTVRITPYEGAPCLQLGDMIDNPIKECLHPVQPLPRRWWIVSYYLPLNPWMLPLREVQSPLWANRHYSQFCCQEAARIYADILKAEGCEEITVEEKKRKANPAEAQS